MIFRLQRDFRLKMDVPQLQTLLHILYQEELNIQMMIINQLNTYCVVEEEKIIFLSKVLKVIYQTKKI